jgi:hypothetical protein
MGAGALRVAAGLTIRPVTRLEIRRWLLAHREVVPEPLRPDFLEIQ